MKTANGNNTGHKTALFCIKTVIYQDQIVHHFKMYITAAAAMVILLVLAGKISMDSAMAGLAVGGFLIAALMVLLIRARKECLLNIRDPQLRKAAHQAMLVYISTKRLSKEEKQHLMGRIDNIMHPEKNL